MITHFANQSQTCQLLKILKRPLYVASFLAIFFFFFFLKIPVRFMFPGHFHSVFFLHYRSVSLYTEFFLAICIFTLSRCCSYSLNSRSDLARLFNFFLALSAKSFCDCKYLSTIACASEDTFGESTAAKFYLIIHPYSTYTVSHQDYYSLHVHLHSVCSIFQRMFCLQLSHLSPYHLFYELHQVSVAACHFSS